MNCGFIYSIKNKLINKIVYIGYTATPDKRFKEHRRAIAYKPHLPLYRHMLKNGSENFDFDIIYCGYNKEHTLRVMEPFFINKFETHITKYGYNLCMGGRGSTNRPLSENAKKRIGEANSNRIVTKETRIRLSNAHKGKKHTEEYKKRQSEWAKKNNIRPILTEEIIERKRLSQIGKPIHSEEEKQKRRERLLEHNPMNNPESIKKANETKKKNKKMNGRNNPRAKKVVIYKDGIVLHEGYISELCNEFGYNNHRLYYMSRIDGPIKRGKHKGFEVICV